MSLIIFGNKDTTLELVKHLRDKDFPIHYVITLDDKEADNYKISGKSGSLISYCLTNKIPIYNPERYDLKGEKDIGFFNSLKPKIALSTGWQRIVPEKVINRFEIGIFGWHGSCYRLPNGRGRSPLNWSIRLGSSFVYNNLFKYESEVDSGGIFETQLLEIDPSDYISDLVAKSLKHIKESSVRLLESLENLELRPQSKESFIAFPKLSERDGFISSECHSATEALNIIRSCSHPFPGAFACSNQTQILRIWKARLSRIPKTFAKKITEELYQHDDGKFMFIFRDGSLILEEYEELNGFSLVTSENMDNIHLT